MSHNKTKTIKYKAKKWFIKKYGNFTADSFDEVPIIGFKAGYQAARNEWRGYLSYREAKLIWIQQYLAPIVEKLQNDLKTRNEQTTKDLQKLLLYVNI